MNFAAHHAGLEAVREEAFAASGIGLAVADAFPASFEAVVSLDPEIRDYTRDSFPPGRPVLDAAIELNDRFKSDIAYEIGATTVTTTPPMPRPALRRGVCQDFAHIMISVGYAALACRPAMSAAICAHRHGRTRRDCRASTQCMPGAAVVRFGHRLDGARSDQRRVCLRDIVGAIGRDYTDVAPIDGVIVGSGEQWIDVSVNVEPVG